jgi:hypothetical protein
VEEKAMMVCEGFSGLGDATFAFSEVGFVSSVKNAVYSVVGWNPASSSEQRRGGEEGIALNKRQTKSSSGSGFPSTDRASLS